MAGGFEWLEQKSKLVVVIFGPYNPPASKTRLLVLRDHLRIAGYSKTYIVEDFNIPLQNPNEN
jgi:hypothetical protein